MRRISAEISSQQISSCGTYSQKKGGVRMSKTNERETRTEFLLQQSYINLEGFYIIAHFFSYEKAKKVYEEHCYEFPNTKFRLVQREITDEILVTTT